jgi:hypothetical protein
MTPFSTASINLFHGVINIQNPFVYFPLNKASGK